MLSALERLRESKRAPVNENVSNRPTNPTKVFLTAGLTLAQFAGSGRAVRIYSDVLGEEVLLAADNARIPDAETRPVYRARELAVIWGEGSGMNADGLRLLHEVKMRFGSEVVAEEVTAEEGATP